MKNQQRVFPARYILGTVLMVIIVPMLPLLASRCWDWWEAWVYAAIIILGYVCSRALAERHNPGLLAERAQILQQADAKVWDRFLVPLWGLFFALTMLAAGLDKLLDGLPAFSPGARNLALLVFLGGNILGSYALIENRFFSGMARIQSERDQQVISSGPYGWIRHPGYAGSLLAYLATPIALGSWWSCVPALLLASVVIVRTRLEDDMLQNELAGYREYARRVRYRLAPGIW